MQILGLDKEVSLQSIDTIRSTITTKFKVKVLWCNEKIENKRNSMYYKQFINPKLEYQNYLSIVHCVKKKINIVKIKTNFHELYREIGCSSRSKTL